MTYTAYTLAERPRLRPHFARLHAVAWPSFLRDDAVNAVWPRLYEEFPEFQIGLLDRSGKVVAIGNTIPIPWDGDVRRLPTGIADVIRRGIEARERARGVAALSALAAIVDPALRARGLSARVVSAMRDVVGRHRLRALIAPVRPSHKGRYPLTPMARYAAWTRADGAPFDPWLRVHWRMGARIMRIVPRGNTVVATVSDWEEWTGLRFPESGRYIVPNAFQPIVVDRRRNRVRYEEANVWMRHRVAGAGVKRRSPITGSAVPVY
jgi:hypothetical protein